MSPADSLGYMATGFLLAAIVTVLVVGVAAVLGAPRALLRFLVWAVPTWLAVLFFVLALHGVEFL